MKTKQVRFVNIDDWNRPVFKQIDAKLYYGSTEKLFPYEESEESVLKTVSEMDLTYFGEKFNCEPMGSQAGDIEIVQPEPKFKYMLLSRYQMDVEYYLNHGSRNKRHLYHMDERKQIESMIALWKELPQKPDWLRAKKLIEYKRQLLLNH